MGLLLDWFELLFPPPTVEAEIHVLSGAATGTTFGVSVIIRTLRIARTNQYTAVSVAGLGGQPLQFVQGGSRTLSAELLFDGRATNIDVRQAMNQVARLMRADGVTHAPPVLRFTWRGESLQCVLESVVEEFRSVFADGRPSRGRLRVVLRESLTVEQLQQEGNLQ